MVSFEKLVERRRYAAVILEYSATSPGDALQALGIDLAPEEPPFADENGWQVSRYRLHSKRLFYPRDLFEDGTAPDRGAGFDHPIYVAASPRQHRLAVLTPYVGLLDRMFGDTPPTTGAQFVAPKLKQLYAGLSSPSMNVERRRIKALRSTRIGIQHNGDKDVQLVSLTGANPLRSDLWRSISKTYLPYSIRLHRIIEDGKRVGPSLNLDRHGNLWAYISRERSIVDALGVIQTLCEEELLETVPWNPLPRRSKVE